MPQDPTSTELPASAPDTWDVLICGAGLAGLTLALQIRQELPQLTVALLEKSTRPLPAACHKVGESSVELGSQYLERLGLYEYLRDNHIIKFGLRFFPGGGKLPLHERLEIGPDHEPIVRSWQLDRGTFEGDLRGMVADAGVTLIEGATVKDITLGPGEEDHVVVAEQDGAQLRHTARWLVDASGRTGLLRRRLKNKRGVKHEAHSGWFRVKGRVDISDMVPASQTEWHGRGMADQRWRSTNHLMGNGYWMWIIPLSSGHTSIGVVVHGDTHDFDSVRTLDNLRAFMHEHEPYLAEHLAGAEALDFIALKKYSYMAARAWSPDRWAMVGEAGSFTDPLYSPGTDLIAFANSFTATLIADDLAGANLLSRTRDLNLMYRALVGGGLKIFRDNSVIYGHPRAMAAKIYFDNFCYWSFPCQYFQQRLYKLHGAAHTKFAWAGSRFVELSEYAQRLMRAWAQLAPEAPEGRFMGVPSHPSILIDAHCALEDRMTPAQALPKLVHAAGQAEELLRELVLRVLQELGPDKAQTVIERTKMPKWDVTFDAARLAIEALDEPAWREALPPLAQDVERSLGAPRRHAEAAQARALLAALIATGEAA